MNEKALSDLSLIVGSFIEAILEDHALMSSLLTESQIRRAFFIATLAMTRAHSLLIAAASTQSSKHATKQPGGQANKQAIKQARKQFDVGT